MTLTPWALRNSLTPAFFPPLLSLSISPGCPSPPPPALVVFVSTGCPSPGVVCSMLFSFSTSTCSMLFPGCPSPGVCVAGCSPSRPVLAFAVPECPSPPVVVGSLPVASAPGTLLVFGTKWIFSFAYLASGYLPLSLGSAFFAWTRVVEQFGMNWLFNNPIAFVHSESVLYVRKAYVLLLWYWRYPFLGIRTSISPSDAPRFVNSRWSWELGVVAKIPWRKTLCGPCCIRKKVLGELLNS